MDDARPVKDQNGAVMASIETQVAELKVLHTTLVRKVDELSDIAGDLRNSLHGEGDGVGLIGRVAQLERDLQRIIPSLDALVQRVDSAIKSTHVCRYEKEIEEMRQLKASLDNQKTENVTWTWVRDKVGQPVIMLLIGYLLFNLVPQIISHLGK